MTIERKRQALKRLNNDREWHRKVDSMSPNEVSVIFKSLRTQEKV